MEYLNVLNPPVHDTSVVKYEYHTYSPLFQNSYGRSDEIRIPIANQDSFILPHKSYLFVTGKIDANCKPETLLLTKNFVSHMFEEIRVELNGITIQSTRNPGLTSTIFHYLTMDRNTASSAPKFCWFQDDNLSMKKKDPFNFIIPCKYLMGFFDDFKNVLINTKFELVLVRTKNEINCHNTQPIDAAATTAGESGYDVKINMLKISLRMPHLFLSDVMKLNILRNVDKGMSFPIFFRAWDLIEQPVQAACKSQNWSIKTTSLLERPRYVIVGFQTKRKNINTANYSNFDHCSITNMKLYLNSDVYPYNNWNLDFATNEYGISYHNFTEFIKSYRGEKTNDIYISPHEYKEKSPLFVFNCLYQEETIKTGSINLRLEFEAANDFPPDTICNIVIVHDRILNYCPLDGTVNLIV